MLKFIHNTLRWFFMRVEGVFNIAFGDKLNPLYHLGTITFWQFWLVCISGLYLFLFADTGVNDAYASIEAITHDQWWAGGIMRSVHRYASDGMIITNNSMRLLRSAVHAAIVAIAPLLVACGSDEGGAGKSSEGASFTIAMIAKSSTNPVFLSGRQGAEAAAAELARSTVAAARSLEEPAPQTVFTAWTSSPALAWPAP